MKVTFIQPSVGSKPNSKYSKSWRMEPLSIAVLSALTPEGIEKVFYDDRIEKIPFHEKTDLVAITIETYTAKRAYQIAEKYRAKDIKVVMGGFHAKLATDEVSQHADSVVVGEAISVWGKLLNDFENNKLKGIYFGQNVDYNGLMPDRTIYKNKKYLALGLVETSKGCYFDCEFCSIYGFYKKNYHVRSIEDIVKDIKSTGKKFFFFIDDNIALDKNRTLALCKALKPLKIKWFSQVSIHVSKDEELLQHLKDAGCVGFLIGFESFNPNTIKMMNKKVNLLYSDYSKAIKKMREFGFIIYGTFVFGYPEDTEQDFKNVLEFSIKNKLYLNAFNHLVPFPGTPLYSRFQKEDKLLYDKWWLRDDYKFGDVVFKTENLTPDELSQLCYKYRKKFYSLKSIFYRSFDFKANCSSLDKVMLFFLSNFAGRKDVDFRQGLPLGKTD